MKITIESLFQTELAESVQLAGSPIKHEKGAKVVANHKLQTKTLGAIMLIAPSPVHLMLNEACRLLDEIAEAKKDIEENADQIVFTSSTDPAITAEKALQTDPNAELVKNIPSDISYRFLQLAMAFHFNIIAAVEVFCTQAIPAKYQLTRVKKSKSVLGNFLRLFGKQHTETLQKPDIERKLSIVEKLEVLGEMKSIVDMKQQNNWRVFMETKKRRDRVVHQKNGGVAIAGYEALYTELFDVDYEESLRMTVELLNRLSNRSIEISS